MRQLKEGLLSKRNIKNVQKGKRELDWKENLYGVTTESSKVEENIRKHIAHKEFIIEQEDGSEISIFMVVDDSLNEIEEFIDKNHINYTYATYIYDFGELGFKSEKEYFRFFNSIEPGYIEKYFDHET